MLEVPNLLVSDDDAAFRRAVSEGLSRRGFHVTQACDGQEAIEMLSSQRVHVALLDVHMPRMSGLEVVRHLYLSESPECPPCVLMSAALNDEIRREAERMRAYQVLSKPVRLQQLTQIVCTALANIYGWHPPDSRLR
jgi:two-component system chemotaxis response regulator CheY